ncbi:MULTISPECIES: hypothetical protein [Pseudomonas]|jgi:hypothetical protein|uniref:Uncharacterized protein n=1 Tax=Pseudomonas citronellolis TaxID=53408 RepID=A0A127N203_9PSED|nr:MULTISPECIES: hypothetical protein [Pseudomonas]AMO79562.1 hypothetical protein PcP3B5_62100 [Pseudomonas citronellolis]ANI18278.1 hypothetical protein A9C11_31615 [Pseudomonas citronellolis]KES23399.1 hypothetical protein FG99_15080 [Pseudomonas sp. AAC]KRV72063.1 hypothetical protein AO742_19185 [Pseudomonas citronellolis]KRW78761.1 hypothetical protein AO738_08580 [Pseudomonas citronellolis]
MNADGAKGDSLGRLLLLAVAVVVLLDRWYPVAPQPSAAPVQEPVSSAFLGQPSRLQDERMAITEEAASTAVVRQTSRVSWVF